MKCLKCGHVAGICDFLDAWINVRRTSNGFIPDSLEVGGRKCPKCGNED